IPSQPGDYPHKRKIDVWWGGLQENGGLMLILAYLLRSSLDWQNAEIRLKLVVPDSTAAEAAQSNLDNLVRSLRIGATPQVLIANGRSFTEILRESSSTADLVFLGMATPNDQFSSYYVSLQERTMGLPPVAFVMAAQDISFVEVLQRE
ncbi:Na-K-Cl cotransporter, partial [filamentous cyanobacterium CCP1]